MNHNALTSITRIREDLEHYLNSELYLITKAPENAKKNHQDALATMILVCYNASLVTMDEVNQFRAAIGLAPWQTVHVKLPAIEDVGCSFDTADELKEYIIKRINQKYDDALSTATVQIQYCLDGHDALANRDIDDARRILTCAANSLFTARANALLLMHLHFVDGAIVERKIASVNQQLDKIEAFMPKLPG